MLHDLWEAIKDKPPTERWAYMLNRFTVMELKMMHGPGASRKRKAELVLTLYSRKRWMPRDIDPTEHTRDTLMMRAKLAGITSGLSKLKKPELALKILLVREAAADNQAR